MGLFAALTSLFGCNAQKNYKSVEVKEFATIIQDTTVVRLDVRTQEEYAQGHIEGTCNIDVTAPDFETKALSQLPKEKTIALYCRSGRRSKKAADFLSQKGYRVVELNSGFNGWTEAHQKTVKD